MEHFVPVTVEIKINATLDKVWNYFTQPEHIVNWNFATKDWICPEAENDLVVGGAFDYRMEAKDKSFGFDFQGVYTGVETYKTIEYELPDTRSVLVLFFEEEDGIRVTEIFDAEKTHSLDMQKDGWQSILNHFKEYVEMYN